MNNNKPVQFIEYKLELRDVSPGLRYLIKHFPETDAIQISLYTEDDFLSKYSIPVCSANKF